MTPGFGYQLHGTDRASAARVGTFQTPHGSVQTPAFMPVGTAGSVKGVTVDQLRATGTQMVLGNTYHLTVRPGHDIVRQLGGLHRFMGWDGPILTDSGGFQLYSLAKICKITDEGAVFRSHVDGRQLELSPEEAVAIQEQLGSDVAMVLDHVVALPSDRATICDAVERTVCWAARSLRAASRPDQTLFAIVQGGLEPDLRAECARRLIQLDFSGYAVGGLSVGETPDQMYEVLDYTCPVLPTDRPRYLMGVGRPQDMLQAIARGVDLLDCVMPTRNGRNGVAFTDDGPLRMRNQQYQLDPRPLQDRCPCPACRHSRGYLRHLFLAREMLGPILLSLHNLTYYQHLMVESRKAIAEGRFSDFLASKLDQWHP